MKNFKLSTEEIQTLQVVHRTTKDKWAADRIKAIIALGGEWSLEEVAEILLLGSETLRNYIKLFAQGGVAGLTQRHYRGSCTKPAVTELKELRQHLSEITYLSVDVAKLLEFLQTFEKMRRSGEPVYSMDGCHPQHNSLPQYGWILKGQTKILPSNSGRKRINIQGTVNLDTYELLSTLHETLDKNSTIELLNKIERANSAASKIYVLVDNAGYYHAQLVKDYLKHSKIKVIFLPAYAPHLSLIDRIWRYFKKLVLYNRYYPTFQEFAAAIACFLKRSHRRAFKKLLVEKFHFARNNSSMLQLSN